MFDNKCYVLNSLTSDSYYITIINTVSAITTTWHHIIDQWSRPLTKNIHTGFFSVIIAFSVKIEHLEP